MRYAEQIKGLRRKLQLNQQQFAEKLLVSQGTVSRWESGAQEPSTEVLERMNVFGDFAESDLIADVGTVFSADQEGREIFIKGQIASNRLVDQIEWNRKQWIRLIIPDVPAWAEYQVSAFLVTGAADRSYADNSIVFVIPFEVGKVEPKPGDKIVYAEKSERSGRFEVIIAEFNEGFEKSYVELSSLGIQIHFNSPLWDIISGHSGFYEAGFIGLVVGGVIVENVNRLRPRPPPSKSPPDE